MSESIAELVKQNDERIIATLQDFFGFNQFKGEQKEIISTLLSGQDTFVIMPTGGGKSLCYQLPALLSKGTTIIISPLIALMKNQVDLVRSFGGRDGVAHFMNSSLGKKELEKVKNDVRSGLTKMLYIAPESLTKEENVLFLKDIHVPFVAVDEAHCISEWGHDFRPEYRRIRQIVENIGDQPIIALTASATPKVQEDIIKNLKMKSPKVFLSSFNRPNLYYEVKPKSSNDKVLREIISYIKRNSGKSGIIYCLSRKSVEDIAEKLRVNDIKALEYHAGLDSNTRAKHQDAFLMEKVDVIVATIAFGMGIDKPDVRFVIHYDVPKSLESYYQETGRAGRDGILSECLMYYSYKDLTKLAKFLNDKPVAEREVGAQLLIEMTSFAENSSCRRKALLHYFGENYVSSDCETSKMCDNCRHPKEKVQAQDELKLVLEAVKETVVKITSENLVQLITGEPHQFIKNYGLDKSEFFGEGKDKKINLWKSVIRQAIHDNYLVKDIESYGTLVITELGEAFINKPEPYTVTLDAEYETFIDNDDMESASGAGMDEVLFNMLKDLRKRVASQNNVPPYIIFQDPSMEEMAIKYPLDLKELSQIVGVSTSKATRYGKPFLELIQKYVEDNEIERPDDFVVKSVANKSALKVSLIQSIDRKLSLEDIANSKGLSIEELLLELENIVMSGTKLNLSYYIDTILDKEYQDEIFDYFRTQNTQNLEHAWNELGADVYTYDEIHLMYIKFISEMAN